MIYLVRHGESMTNAKLHKQSKNQVNINNNVLTMAGVAHALRVGLELREAGIDVIICSPYARTKQTAFTIASALQTCPTIIFDERLEEIKWVLDDNWVHFEDTDILYDDVEARPAPGTESQRDVYNRVIPVFVDLSLMHADKNILVVTHYFPCRAFLSHYHGMGFSGMPEFDPQNLDVIKVTTRD